MGGRSGPLLAACAVALALLALASPASAHAEVLTSDPAQGARLDTAPTQVVVHLSEPIEPSATTLVVIDTEGKRVDRDDLRIEEGPHPVLTLSLRDDVGPGAYAIVWKTLSRTDGHPSGDRIGFAIGDFEPPAGAGPAEWPPMLAVAGRGLAYAGLALAFGAAAWLWYVRADVDGMGRTARKALAIGTALHVVGVLLLIKATADSTDLPPGTLAASQVGRLLTLRLVAGLGAFVLAGLAVVPRNPARLGAPLAAVLMVVAGIGSASIGHPAGEGLPGLAVDAMHLLASATWVGGLVLLVVALGKADRAALPVEQVRRLGLRFGTLALTCVILLFLAGAATSIIVLGLDAVRDPFGLLEGLYGQFLVAKVALALLMVALAAANRFVFLDPREAHGLQARVASAAGPDGTHRGFRRTVVVEATVGVTVLVLAAFLTAVSPTAAEDGPGGDAVDVYADGGLFHYHMTLSPAPVLEGRSDLVLGIVDLATGEPLTENTCGRDSCVQVTVAAAEGDQGDATYVLVPDGAGHWSMAGLLWTYSGPATASVQVQTAVSEDNVVLPFTIA